MFFSSQNLLYPTTLQSKIEQGIILELGRFGEKNKRRAMNKHRASES